MRPDLQNPKHPKGWLSEMRLIIDKKVWKVDSIETGSEIYSYPFGWEYLGFKYRCSRGVIGRIVDESSVTKEQFVTKETHPEYWL